MFTRLCLNKFLVFFIIFVINTSYANNFSAEYKVSTTGIKIGNFSWSLNINDNIYQTEINLKNSGIFSPLYKFEGSYLSTGVIENNIFKTKNYKQFWKTMKKTKIVKNSFDDYLIELKQEPIEEEIARVDLKELGLKVRDLLRDKILNKVVTLYCGELDKYGRLLVDINYGSENINHWLITNGYAYEYNGGKKKSWDF